MIARRDFLKASLVVAAGAVVGSASGAEASLEGFPSGIIYTADNPGQWAAKVALHSPVVTRDGNTITVRTMHPMSEIHYIVRHTLVAENGTVIGAITFAPEDKEPVSTYDLPENAGARIYATSFCNQHDFWVTEFSL